MSDNVTANAGSGGATFATDDDGTAHHPYVKIEFGADNTQTKVSTTNPLPVTLANTGANSTAVKVDGSAVTQPVSGTVTETNSAAIAASLAVLEGTAYTQSATIGSGKGQLLSYNQAGAATFVGGTSSAIFTMIRDAAGNSRGANVDASNQLLVAEANSSAIKTAVELVDDVVSTDSSAIGSKGLAICVSQSGTARMLRGDANGAVHGIVRDAAGNDRGANVNASNEMLVALSSLPALAAGTNGIGKLTANSGVDIGDVDVTSVVPGTGATSLGKAEDAAHSSGDTGVMALAVRNDDLDALATSDGDYAPLQVTQNGALLVCNAANDDYKYAVIDNASSGDNTLVSAVASRKIRVLALFLVSAGTVNVRFESGAGGTALTGVMNLVANTGFSLPYNPAGWFETAVNTLLNLELSGAVSVDGSLTYIEVP